MLTLQQIAETTGLPIATVVGINARVRTEAESRARRSFHAFVPIPFETHRCIQCDDTENEGAHFSADDEDEEGEEV